jgi:hypothetical protein
MITWLLRAFDTVRAIRQDAEVWAHHLTGEGPGTIRRQREAITRALPARPPAPWTAPSAYGTAPSAYQRSGYPGAPTTTAPGQRGAFTVR